MDGTFKPQILVDKLATLNNSQQSIKTLSDWCIFHMNKAKLVVETWERQFHCSPRAQRQAYLYLANDVLQTSRKKGGDFVAEFWKVLPEALRDVIRNGDDSERNAAFRLINIWDDRKVFGSRGHILKEEFMGKQPVSNNKSGRQPNTKLKQSAGNTLDKVVSGYEVIYGGQLDEDIVVSKCSSTISTLEEVAKDIASSMNPVGKFSESGIGDKLKGEHAALNECIEKLATYEASRFSLVSQLKDVLQEQESKLEQVRGQLRAALSQSEHVANLCQQPVSCDNISLQDKPATKEAYPSALPNVEMQANLIVYTRQVPLTEEPISTEDDSRKLAAAAVVAKLAASTDSADILSHVLTSLVSGGIISDSSKESMSHNAQSEKRPKLENVNNANPPPGDQPNLPSLGPTAPYPITPQLVQSAGSMSNVAYSYGATPQPGLGQGQLLGFPSLGAPVMGMSPYAAPALNVQVSEGGFYSPASTVQVPPVSRKQN